MKLRFDFVSNSSSTSFVLLGKSLTFDKFVSCVKKAGFKSQDADEYEDYVDIWEIKDWIAKKTKNFIELEADGDDGYYNEVFVGVDPSKMKNTEILKDFKDKVAKTLNKIGIDVKWQDIYFESGGSDASGVSFIGSRG